MTKKELWLNLCHYHFAHLVPAHLWDLVVEKFGGPDASTKAFADKLSRKLGWTKTFAMRAIWEYKKFVYLGVTADFSVTPSRIIDQVWHEHLLFSTGYRNFCDEIIRYDFIHSPELVPLESQAGVFQAQYADTIALYENEFGVAPPDDIWGNTKFDPGKQKVERASAKKESAYVSGLMGGPDTLVSMFPDGESSYFDFGGGEFGGGGASGSWDNAGSSTEGDSGCSSDGCTSCSSGCSAGGD